VDEGSIYGQTLDPLDFERGGKCIHTHNSYTTIQQDFPSDQGHRAVHLNTL